MADSFPRPSDARLPQPVARAADLMSSFPGSWALCGGWAVDAWLGHPTREHKDVDVAIFEEDLPLVAGHFADWRLIAHDETEQDSEDPWDGRWLILPAHIHVRRPGDIDLELLDQRPAGRTVGP